MKVLAYNKILEYNTIAATNEYANYPVENIFHYYLSKRFQTTAGSASSVITITFSADKTMDCFFMSYTNLGVGSTVVVRFYNAAAALLLTLNLATTDYKVLKNFHTALTTVRSMTITITNSIAATAFYVGSIWEGDSITLPDAEAYAGLEFANAATGIKSQNGNAAGQARGLLDRININLHLIDSETMWNTIKTYYETVNASLPHFIAPYEDIDKFSMYCTITDSNIGYIMQNEPNYEYKNITIKYEEAK